MGQNVLIHYFTGTGNSKKVSNMCKKELEEAGYNVRLNNVTDEIDDNNYDIYGFVFPVYAFGLPKIANNFLKQLSRVENKPAFVIVNYGSYGTQRILEGYEGNALYQAKNLLKKRGYKVIGTEVIPMPANFVILSNTPKPENIEQIILKAELKVKKFINKIVNGKEYFKRTFFVFRLFSWLINKFFVWNTWYSGKLFYTDKKCTGCGICSKICPTDNIKMVNQKPKWGLSCETCLRCINICPQKSIQAITGTKKRRRYIESDFKGELVKKV